MRLDALLVLEVSAPARRYVAAGRDLSQRRQPQNGRHDHFTNAGACRLVRCTQFRYMSGAEPNGWSMRPALSSAGERVTNFCKGCPAWRHPERILEMDSTDAEAS